MPFAEPDVQTQGSRLERLNGLRGMAWAYAVCHYLGKTPSAISLEYSAAESSLGPTDGPKRSSNLMHRYISGKSAAVRGASLDTIWSAQSVRTRAAHSPSPRSIFGCSRCCIPTHR